jgi:phosphatidate cytidylyltransferase
MRTLTNFQQRFLMSIFGIAILILVLATSHNPPFQFLFLGALSYVQAISLKEYYTMCKTKALFPSVVLGMVFSVCYIFFHYCARDILAPLFAFLGLSFLFHFKTHKQAVGNIAATFFGFCYITLPLSLTIDINFLGPSNSCFWMVYLIVTTKMTDMAAYFSGKLLGKRLLTPILSPKKTQEGAIGGILGAALSSFLFYLFSDSMKGMVSSGIEACLLGAVLGLVAEIGDLAESLLKRDAKMKDSSQLPGFGGMLDIVDSLLFTTPLLYFWLTAL